MKRNRGRQKFSAVGIKRYVTVAAQVLVLVLTAVLVYSLLDHFLIRPPAISERAELDAPTKVEQRIQVSVRNECGVNDIAMDFTNYLRSRGFDVVETTNGSMFDRPVTTVVDAAGDYQNALRVAQALGVKKENVMTRLDPHAYVDVEVLIGKDYQNLKPKESIE